MVSELALRENHDVIYERWGLRFTTEVSFERWAEIGTTLAGISESVMWWLGDWWRYGEWTYGEAAAQAAPTGYAVKTLQNAAWICDRIPPERRRPELTYSLHAAVAALEASDQKQVLDEAVAEGLTVRQVRERVRELRGRSIPGQATPAIVVSLRELVGSLEAAIKRSDTKEARNVLAEIARVARAAIAGGLTLD